MLFYTNEINLKNDRYTYYIILNRLWYDVSVSILIKFKTNKIRIRIKVT